MPTTAESYVPAGARLGDLRAAVNGCRGCDLYRDATQAVFSSGRTNAAVVMVGETPGDVEDRKGAPFVGPAGGVLKRAMAEAGIALRDTYLTNAVKHFKFHPDERGKRRLHDKPRRSEIVACRPWLTAEFHQLRPRVVIALGATAAESMVGPSFRVTRSRGRLLDWPDVSVHPEDFPRSDPPARFIATVHPSAVLRADDREAAYAEFLADLVTATAALG
jgi:uracil-DNA glycosylase family protein